MQRIIYQAYLRLHTNQICQFLTLSLNHGTYTLSAIDLPFYGLTFTELDLEESIFLWLMFPGCLKGSSKIISSFCLAHIDSFELPIYDVCL